MGAKTSEAMRQARILITEKGFTQYEAAKKTGITRGAISQTKWYQEYKIKMFFEKCLDIV